MDSFGNVSQDLLNLMVPNTTGIYNKAYKNGFWCPKTGIPTMADNSDDEYIKHLVHPDHCPAVAAKLFWEREALQQSSGMDDFCFGDSCGFHWGLLASLTFAWGLVYPIIFKGVASSGKVVYVTALLPYVALIAFFIRAITLDGAMAGINFYIKPDLSILKTSEPWLRAATQIFYSLGVGFGSLVAFASYGDKKADFAGDSTKVALINCGTSLFAGFVVFPILGNLCMELS